VLAVNETPIRRPVKILLDCELQLEGWLECTEVPTMKVTKSHDGQYDPILHFSKLNLTVL
jgi:hypothetical protein